MSGAFGILRRLGSTAKTSFALVGLGTTVYGANEIKKYNDAHPDLPYETSTSKEGQKNVLVLPFHRMKIVEQKKKKFSISSLSSKLSDDDSGVVEVEIKELVDAIHAAAEDPNIVALHGKFGHCFGFNCGGFAHVEEIRNAIRVFNESHRRHFEPQKKIRETGGKDDNANHEKERNASFCNIGAKKKISYAFADTFDHPMDPGNKEYFLASAFSQVHMQTRGNVNLFGVSATNCFLADAFEKYGLTVHVFKHGHFKNAPNSLTETGYTHAHYMNTKAILDSINGTIYSSISQSRALPEVFDNTVWKNIHNYGTMTAENAQEIKFVDHLPRVNPIFDLITMNKEKGEKISETLRKKWDSILKGQNFEGNREISLSKYTEILRERKKWQNRKCQLYQKVKDAASNSTAIGTFLGAVGYQAPYFGWDKEEVDQLLTKFTKEKVAVIHITGGIDNKIAKSVTKAFRQVKKDENFKCMVLRVDSPGGSVTASETILEECKDVGIPVVCSFSNLAASGGYYISAFSDKIFAQKTTVTGSIGVFGIKLDATEAARRHGVHFDSVAVGKHAGTYSLFEPLNHSMKTNLSRNMDRIYNYFKKIVSEGRGISLEETEKVAKGRVWTGAQAKDMKLIDDFGGIHHAISYAISNYTTGGLVEVEVFPKPKQYPFIGALDKVSTVAMDDNRMKHLLNEVMEGSVSRFVAPCSVLMCIDERTAMQTIINDACRQACSEE